MKETNHTKLMNLAIEETSSSKTISPTNNNSNPKDINHLKDGIKTTSYHPLITSLRIAITMESLAIEKEIAESYNETNKTGVINITLCYNNLITNHHYHQLTIYQDHNIKPTTINLLVQQNQFAPQNQFTTNNNKINPNNQLVPRNPVQPRPIHYYTQPSYLIISEEQDFHHTALLEARIAKNANLSDIFSFEFKANKSLFLLSNAATNEQKAITAMYTKTEVKGKAIYLILDSRSARSIITYQLMQQLKRNVDRPAQIVIVIADNMKKTPVGEIDNFSFTLDGITILVKVLIMDTGKLKNYNSPIKDNMSEYLLLVKAPVFEFEEKEEKPVVKTFMALESTSNWADETEQQTNDIQMECPLFKTRTMKTTSLYSTQMQRLPQETLINRSLYFTRGRIRKPYLLLLQILPPRMMGTLSQRKNNYLMNVTGLMLHSEEESCPQQTVPLPSQCQNDFDLAMALINRATQENVCQMKESEYIAYTFEIARYNYEDEVKVYYQIASHTYLTKEAQAQRLEQMNIKFIPLPSENNENKIEFKEPKATEEIEATFIYFIKNQPALQLKYFNNNGQEIKSEKAHEIDAGYDLRYPDKNTFVLKPKSLTKINLKIALKIPPGAMVQITSWSFLASKKINVRGEIIDAGYTGDITIILQNKTNKPFKIEHAEKIAQAIYLLLINILGLQLVNQRKLLGKSEKETQGFGSTGRFTVSVNIALNKQKESHQIL
ncbi:hypothetical protein G9A89_003046 [Geosiphon pyriformis]|nr:hypothetical protein G9A89_003046 [Geosiphon pyriformis]